MLYLSFKFVRKFKFCVSPLVKRYPGLEFTVISSKFNTKKNSGNIIHISEKMIRNVKSRIHVYSLPVNLHKHQLYLLEQHRETLKILVSNYKSVLGLTLRVNP